MSSDDRLVDLLMRCEELRERGQPIDLESICRDCPEMIAELRRALRWMDEAKDLFTPEERTGERDTDVWAPPLAAAPKQVGDYEVLGRLGEGGMGIVYQARHVPTQRLVALKLMRDGLASAAHFERFRREADTMKKLRHPNIVQLLDAGQHDGRPFFVMELITGGGLDRQLQGQPQPALHAAQAVEALARAVHDAHTAGVIHRDLKPSNVLVTSEGALKITDFGLAKRLDVDLRQTTSGAVLGTPAYMSPEQAAGQVRQIGPPADVWALGVILYEMLTGELPFTGSTPFETLQQVCGADPRPPAQLQPDCPRDLETICLKCLHKEPARRYTSALELADDLRNFQEDRPIKARPVGLGERLLKWRRRNPVKTVLGATVLLLLVVGAVAGTWYWDRYRRIKVAHFANLVSRFGVKEGVGKLTAEEVKRRRFSYKVYRRGGRVVRIDVVNGQGELTAEHSTTPWLVRGDTDVTAGTKRECRFEYRRNEQGEVVEEWAFDHQGNVVWVLHSPSRNAAFYANEHGTPEAPGAPAAQQLDRGTGFPEARTRSGAGYLRFARWSPEGFAEEVHYLDRDGALHPDDGGVFGARYAHDERGLVVRQTYLGKNGEPATHGLAKYATETTRYDDKGSPIEQAYFGPDDRPTLNKDGVARVRMQYDERGNRTELAFFGPDGQPTLHRIGAHRVTARYDERGNQVENAVFGTDGRPTLTRDGIHKMTAEHDPRGHRIVETCFGVDDRPTLNKDAVHRIASRYDENGNRIEKADFGLDGRPVLNKQGYHKVVGERDERGRLIGLSYFGVDGKPVLNKDGAHRRTARLDERGNAIDVACFGGDGRAVLDKKGAHRIRLKLGPAGNTSEEAYFGRDDEPILTPGGYHKTVSRRDNRGNLIELALFDARGKPALHRLGYHKVKSEYDDRGNLCATAFFGLGDEPVRCRPPSAREIEVELDDRASQLVALAKDALAATGDARKKGPHLVRMKHDEGGKRIEKALFDVDGRPIVDEEGIHKITTRYDQRGNAREQAFFGADDRPALRQGHARARAKYDERDQLTEVAFFDAAGKPARASNGTHGYRARHDARGNRIETSYFGGHGKPCRHKDGHAGFAERYDRRDNAVEMTFFGLDGKPARTVAGWAKVRSQYDERDNLTEMTALDAKNRPRQTLRFDTLGQTRYAILYLSAAEAAAHGKGVAQKHVRLNEKRQIAERLFTDAAGKLVLTSQGYAGVALKYDRGGNLSEVAHFGPDRRPIAPPGAAARQTMRYDRRGNLTEVAYFDAKGKPAPTRDGTAKLGHKYDDHDRTIETTSYDEEGRPLLVLAFDGAGRVTQKTAWLPPPKGDDPGPGVHRARYVLDGKNRLREVAYVGKDGKLVTTTNGYARCVVERDGKGNEVGRRYYSADDKELKVRVVITGVVPGGQGERLGLKVGDVLERYGEQPVLGTQAFVAGRQKEGKTDKSRPLRVLRKDRTITVQVLPGPLGVVLSDVAVPRGK
jgi:hypothetical protein